MKEEKKQGNERKQEGRKGEGKRTKRKEAKEINVKKNRFLYLSHLRFQSVFTL